MKNIQGEINITLYTIIEQTFYMSVDMSLVMQKVYGLKTQKVKRLCGKVKIIVICMSIIKNENLGINLSKLCKFYTKKLQSSDEKMKKTQTNDDIMFMDVIQIVLQS